MLLAEIHGKTLEEGRNGEDYLTSAVFGHLRYVPPGAFWADALGRARTAADATFATLVTRDGGPPITSYKRLVVHFWPRRPTYGEPDLILAFTGEGLPSLIVLVEVKLGAEKSGTGERDQLVRYLDLLDDAVVVAALGLPATTRRFVVYLTPRDSSAELRESARLAPRREDRLFRLQWQDVLVAARLAALVAPEPARTVLMDVARFLAALGLEYFGGFKDVPALAAFEPQSADFAVTSPARFRGFADCAALAAFEVQIGGWVP